MKRVTATPPHPLRFSQHRIALIALTCVVAGFLAPTHAEPTKSPGIQMGSAAGFRRYRPGGWSVVGVSASNPTDEAAEVLAVVYFSQDPTLQYGRKIWVPPHSIISSTCPIRLPDSLEPGAGHVSLIPIPIDQTDGTDKRGLSHADAMGRSRPLLVNDDSIAVGILGDYTYPPPSADATLFHAGPEPAQTMPDDPVYDLVLACRKAAGLSRRVSILDAQELPADAASLDGLDVLVLCSDHLTLDPDATALVRDWLLRGGYLWIMLDEVGQESTTLLLGGAFSSVVVDQVKRTELQIEDVRTDHVPDELTNLEFEEPVAFARVLPGDVTITDKVDGWPASFWQPFGEGKVFYTTLGPHAWYRPAMPGDPRPKNKSEEVPFVPRQPLVRLANLVFAENRPGPFDVAVVEPYLTEQIGYRILSREVVAAILATFCGTLCVVGVWLWKIGRLGHLLWLGPAFALGTSLAFFGMATTARNAVPPTAALWQRIVVEPGGATGHVSGLAALYNPVASDSPLGATRGGQFQPDMDAMGGSRRRLVWTDEGAWHWEGLSLPPGIRTAPLTHVLHLEEAIDCRARFGPSGLTGALDSSPFSQVEDAVIVVPGQPALTTRIRADGSFGAGANDVLASGEFLADTWLSDVQQRHTNVYRLLLQTTAEKITSKRPVLHFWASSAEDGFTFPQSNQIGSALVSIPVRLERSPPGTGVAVPASFLPFRGIIGPDGHRPSAYSSLAREWGELTTAATEWLRFQVPESVLPMELTCAVVTLDVRAPSRLVEILGLCGETPVVVKELTHPIGTYQTVIERQDLLQLDDQGGLTIAVRVSGEEAPSMEDYMRMAPWKIESLRMNIVGKVQGD